MSIKKLLTGVAVLGIAPISFAQDYFDFGEIPGVPDRPAVQIDLDPMLLGFASAAASAEDPAVANLLSNIDAVRVQVYKSIENIDDVVGFINDTSNRLERDDWQQVVRVQEDGEVRVYVRGDGETLTGATVMVVSDQEAVFINVAGTINAADLAQVTSSLGGDELLASLSEISLGN